MPYKSGENAHHFLTIPDIANAMSLANDRNIIADQLYGNDGKPACNFVNGPSFNVFEIYLACTQDIKCVNAILDGAGAVGADGVDIREANGAPMRLQYQSSTKTGTPPTCNLAKT